MRGEPNTKITLTIARKDEDKPIILTITREEIRVQSVKSKVVEPGYAWLRMTQFQEPTVDDMSKKLAAIYAQEPNLKGMVLDLRNDPGGVLPGAIGVAAAFLPKDSVVVSTNGQFRAPSRPSTPREFTLPTRCRIRCRACRPPSRRCRWWSWSTAARPRPPKSWPVPCRTTSAPPSWVRRPSARVRCTVRLPPEKNTAVKLTTARYYTPKAVPSRRAASCRTSWWTKPGWRWPERPAPA
jgi:carboxyl-terminal processing protease